MNFLDTGYAKVYTHKGLDIAILKSAAPKDGFDYAVDDERFAGQTFNLLGEAVDAVDDLFQTQYEPAGGHRTGSKN